MIAKTCIPWAVGVPAAGGHPSWWNLAAPPVPDFNRRIDDPRWEGSFAATYLESGNGAAAETGIFRALFDSDASGRYLYLSWWVQVDPVLTPATDRITVGFQTEAGPTYVIRLPAFNLIPPAATPDQAIASPGSTAYTATGAMGAPWTITALPNTPNWISQYERSWVDSSSNSWAVNLRVPLFNAAGAAAGSMDDTGIDVGTNFRLWFEVKVTTTGAAGSYFHIWPRAVSGHSSATTVPDATTWGDVRTGGGPEDATCKAGIWIDSTHIGTLNTDQFGNPTPNVIKWDRVTPVVNTFFARPKNSTGATINSQDLHARFRLAEWGSQPDWNDVPDPTQLWTDILPGLNDVQGPSANVADGGFANITGNWTMTTMSHPSIDDFDPPGPGKKRAHQCMLVDLSGGGFDFGRSSVYANMNIEHASELSREAIISVKGLGALGSATHRNVYLYVQALNMPRDVEPRQQPPPGGSPPEGPPAGIHDTPHAVFGVRGEGREEPPATGWQIAQMVPTHMVHVFNETGETYEEDDGSRRPVLRAQTSFGFFIQHDGPLYGWDHGLEGDLEELAPNFYKLRVPNDGTATVTQKVTAHETPRPPAGQGCLGQVLALFDAIRKLFK